MLRAEFDRLVAEEARLPREELSDLERPFFIEFAIADTMTASASAKLGATLSKNSMRYRQLRTDVRVGSYELDNTNFSGDQFGFSFGDGSFFSEAPLPIEDDYLAIRQSIWWTADRDYKGVVEQLAKKKAFMENKVVEGKPNDFSRETPTVYFDPRLSADGTISDAAPEAFRGLDRYEARARVLEYLAGLKNKLPASVTPTLGPDATGEVLANRNKAFANGPGWEFAIGPFFKRGIMLLDFAEHLYHRRIMQQAFTTDRLSAYLEGMNQEIDRGLADWVLGERFEIYPSIKRLTLDLAATTLLGGEIDGNADAVNKAFRDAANGRLKGILALSEDEIEYAVTTSQLANDLPQLTYGLDTILGERGVTLSGGQKQRTAIARALLKDPPIVVLDDALSHVDTHTEEEILRRLRGFMRGRTTILIAHRPSTIRLADRESRTR